MPRHQSTMGAPIQALAGALNSIIPVQQDVSTRNLAGKPWPGNGVGSVGPMSAGSAAKSTSAAGHRNSRRGWHCGPALPGNTSTAVISWVSVR